MLHHSMPTKFAPIRLINTFVAIIIAASGLSITSCAQQNEPTVLESSPQQLLSDFENNRLRWEKLGAKDYSFSVHKDCDCETEANTPIIVEVDDDDENDDAQIDASTTEKPNAKPRSFNGDQTNSVQINTAPRVENMERYFADLRQAIANNNISNVSYDSTYGFPKVVQTKRDNINGTRSRTFHTRDFRLNQNVVTTATSIYSGILVADTANNRYRLIDNVGAQWELVIPPPLIGTVASLVNGAPVAVIATWQPGGITGFGYLLVSQIAPEQKTFNLSIFGVLNLKMRPDGSGIVESYQLIDRNDMAISLDVSPNAMNAARLNDGKSVEVKGSWIGTPGLPGARFIAIEILAAVDLVKLTGTLSNSGSPILPAPPGTSPSQPPLPRGLFLNSDNGKQYWLLIPPTMLERAFSALNRNVRVQIDGMRVYDSTMQRTAIEVGALTEIPNIFTDTFVEGVILNTTTTMTTSVDAGMQYVYSLRTNSGEIITARVSNIYTNAFALTSTRIRVAGRWIANNTTTERTFEATAPVEIAQSIQLLPTTISGTITNIGRAGDFMSCSKQNAFYSVTTSQGKTYEIRLMGNTIVNGAARNYMFLEGDKVELSGVPVSLDAIQAVSITLLPTQLTTITGTVTSDSGPVGDTFTCLGPRIPTTVRGDDGIMYSISSGVGGVGSRVQITGIVSGESIIPREIVKLGQPGPEIEITGYVIAEACDNGINGASYVFADNQGRVLNVRGNIGAGTFPIEQQKVVGRLNGDVFYASSMQAIINTLPYVPPPIAGTITSVGQTEQRFCATLYNYTISNAYGQPQNLVATTQFGVLQPFAVGTRISSWDWLQTVSFSPVYVRKFDQAISPTSAMLIGRITNLLSSSVGCCNGISNVSYEFTTNNNQVYILYITVPGLITDVPFGNPIPNGTSVQVTGEISPSNPNAIFVKVLTRIP